MTAAPERVAYYESPADQARTDRRGRHSLESQRGDVSTDLLREMDRRLSPRHQTPAPAAAGLRGL